MHKEQTRTPNKGISKHSQADSQHLVVLNAGVCHKFGNLHTMVPVKVSRNRSNLPTAVLSRVDICHNTNKLPTAPPRETPLTTKPSLD